MAFKSILDPEFEYRDAASTDIRLTFARIRDELQKRQLQPQPAAKVVALPGSRREPANHRNGS